MKPYVLVTQDQIDEQMARAVDAMEHGSQCPEASFEEGVLAALAWAFGSQDCDLEVNDPPMEG